MAATDTTRKPRISLERGERATGQIAAGPNNFWRVPLDEATLEWENQLLKLSGKETRLVTYGETVFSCLEQFWEGFKELQLGLAKNTIDLDWLPSNEARWLYGVVMKARYLEVVAPSPATKDGEEYNIVGEFWDDYCPGFKNVRPARLVDIDW